MRLVAGVSRDIQFRSFQKVNLFVIVFQTISLTIRQPVCCNEQAMICKCREFGFAHIHGYNFSVVAGC